MTLGPVHGQRIDLLEVEAQIAACPGVTGACVVVRDEGQAPAAPLQALCGSGDPHSPG